MFVDHCVVSPDLLCVGQLCIFVPILEWDNPAGKTFEARSQYALHPYKQEVSTGLAHQRQEAQSANQHPQPNPPTRNYTESSTLLACQQQNLSKHLNTVKILHVGYFSINV